MKKKILCVFLSVAVLVSMFAFSFSASAREVTYTRRWVHSDTYGSVTYWYTFTGITKDAATMQRRYCQGTRIDNPGGYIYEVNRANNEPFKTFVAQVDFASPTSDLEKWLPRVTVKPGETVRITIQGDLEGNFDWNKTWYHIYSLTRNKSSGIWSSEDYVSSVMMDNGNHVDYAMKLNKISDKKAFFYLTFNVRNTLDYDVAIRGFQIDIVTHKAMTSFKFGIRDVIYQITDGAPPASSEFESVDQSTDTTIAIGGFFSFLNKPLNNILTFLGKVGDFIWSKTPTFLQDSLNAAESFFDGFFSTLSSFFQTFFVDPLVENFKNLISNIKSFVSDPLGTIKDLIENIKTTVSNIASAIWDFLPEWLKNALIAIRDFTVNFYNTISTAISDFFSARLEDIKTLLSNIGDAFR